MKIKDLEINYVQYGNKKGKNIILLHGWGQNIFVMDTIGKKLEKYFNITNIDLPGFGKSETPKEAFTIYNYREIIEILLNKLRPVKTGLFIYSLFISYSKFRVVYVKILIEVDHMIIIKADKITKTYSIKKNINIILF